MSMTDAALIEWLLDSDPALRWQVERDLLHAPADVWQATRARVTTEGFGAELLAAQDDDGQWAGGAFFPAGFTSKEFEEVGQPWTATTWSLNALREWGVDAAALADTANRLAENCHWEYDKDALYWAGEVDCCVNGYTLANGTWLGADVSDLATWFVEHQMKEGGWNCDWVEGATRSSFHSTLNSLRGLLSHEIETGGTEASRAARHRGEEYLLQRRLSQRLSTNELVGPWVIEFAYPSRWVYSVLKAADYFRAATQHDDRPRDERIGHAIGLIEAARQPDGKWLQESPHRGRVWLEVDSPPGQPSKWVTFIALRVLHWWDSSR